MILSPTRLYFLGMKISSKNIHILIIIEAITCVKNQQKISFFSIFFIFFIAPSSSSKMQEKEKCQEKEASRILEMFFSIHLHILLAEELPSTDHLIQYLKTEITQYITQYQTTY